MQSNSSSMTEEAPRSFSRGRLSRGRGLRKTTGCLTCRRRHVKCDEVKPRCGGCTRKKVCCEYTKASEGTRKIRRQLRHDASDQPSDNADPCPVDRTAESSPGVAATPVSSASHHQQHPVPEEAQPLGEVGTQDIHVLSDDQAHHVFPLDNTHPGETVSIGNGEEARHSNAHMGRSPQHSIPSHDDYGATTYPHLDPIVCGLQSPAQHPFHSMQMPYGSPPGTSLTLKWLDLLIGDATVNYGPSSDNPFELGGINVFGNSPVQSPTAPTALGETAVSHTSDDLARATESRAVETRVETQNAYLRERISSGKQQSRDKDQPWQTLEPINLQTQELILFRHFTDQISPWMDLFEPQRPFGSFVPHLALHNVGLMNAILALSARHLGIMNRDGPCYAGGLRPAADDTIGYYYKTLHYCQEAMQYAGYKISLELLASAFIISAYEMLDGSNTDWEKHLKGVFWIQRSQIIHGHSDGLRQAIWWAWLCQDVWAAFREKRKPFTFWRPNRPLADLNPSELAARAVYNLAQVVGFCAQDDAPKTPDYIAMKTHEADLLDGQLDHWASYLTSEFQPLPMAAPDAESNPFPHLWIQPPPFAVSMQVYHCSRILLELHRPCSGGYQRYIDQQRTLKRSASTVCGIAKTSTDQASSVLSSQCVFIAGMVVEDASQRSAILDILDTCSRRAGWPGYSLGNELKDIWRV